MVLAYTSTHHLANDKDGDKQYPHRLHGRYNVYTRLPVNLPYESYLGAFVSPRFRIQKLYIQSEFLDIYAVTCMDRESSLYEAQAFSLSVPRGSSDDSDSGSRSGDENSRLLASRRRRMRRIYRSQNFVDSFECGDRRFLVSSVERSYAELRDVCHQVKKHQQPHGGRGAAGYSQGEMEIGERGPQNAAKESEIPRHGRRYSGCSTSSPGQELSSPVAPCLPSDSPKPLSYAQATAVGLKSRNSFSMGQVKGGGRAAGC